MKLPPAPPPSNISDGLLTCCVQCLTFLLISTGGSSWASKMYGLGAVTSGIRWTPPHLVWALVRKFRTSVMGVVYTHVYLRDKSLVVAPMCFGV